MAASPDSFGLIVELLLEALDADDSREPGPTISRNFNSCSPFFRADLLDEVLVRDFKRAMLSAAFDLVDLGVFFTREICSLSKLVPDFSLPFADEWPTLLPSSDVVAGCIGELSRNLMTLPFGEFSSELFGEITEPV